MLPGLLPAERGDPVGFELQAVQVAVERQVQLGGEAMASGAGFRAQEIKTQAKAGLIASVIFTEGGGHRSPGRGEGWVQAHVFLVAGQLAFRLCIAAHTDGGESLR